MSSTQAKRHGTCLREDGVHQATSSYDVKLLRFLFLPAGRVSDVHFLISVGDKS